MIVNHNSRWLVCVGFFATILVNTVSAHVYLAGEWNYSYGSFSEQSASMTYHDGVLTDAYHLNNASVNTNGFSLQGGYQFPRPVGIATVSVGLGFYSTLSPYHLNGSMNETASGDPTTKLYNNQFNVSSKRVMLETQASWELPSSFVPFVNVGLGRSWNEASGYQETKVGSGGISVPPFASKTLQNVAYQIGIGVGYQFNFKPFANDAFKHERFSVGYRWANLGAVSFDTRGATYPPYDLDLGHLVEQSIYLNFTHLF